MRYGSCPTPLASEFTMRTALRLVLLSWCTLAFAGESHRPEGKNCDLNGPPHSAGEELNHGTTLRIFPRAKDIDSSYIGCQSVWAPDEEGWVLISIVFVESGDPVRIWSPHIDDPRSIECVYQKGKVVKGDPRGCPAPQFLLQKFLAPSCVEKIRSSVAENGLAALRPPGCEYE